MKFILWPVKNLKTNLKKSFCYFKDYGLMGLWVKLTQKLIGDKYVSYKIYHMWIKKNEPGLSELNKQKIRSFEYCPKISIIVPVYNTPLRMLTAMIKSVVSQTYSNWELCIADASKNCSCASEIINRFVLKDKRIKVKYLPQNKGIAGNSNEAISLATGDFIALLDHDDIIAPFALFEVVKAINENPQVDLMYSDEDKITENSKRRYAPFFKPDFSPDTLRSLNYVCHFTVIRSQLGKSLGWFREGFEGAQDHDLIFRVSEKAKKIVHIPKILYHWRAHRNSTAMDLKAKPLAPSSGKRCVEEHLQRLGLRGEVLCDEESAHYAIRYEIKDKPFVSVIIPNKDQSELLEKCVTSIIKKSGCKDYEIIIVENSSLNRETFQTYQKLGRYKNIRIIEWNHPFNFSALNNYAAAQAKGEILLFLNNDTEIINAGCFEKMLEYAIRKDVGAVGAKLYYSDGTIQHGGIIIGLGGIAGHAHKSFSGKHPGYFRRLQIVQNLSAVTAACLMTRRDVFKEVGGFDETFSMAFNDVDLCLKMREKGYLIIWTPYAELYHHESKTRGSEDTQEKQDRFQREMHEMKKRWETILKFGDPYYNPNMTLVGMHGFGLKTEREKGSRMGGILRRRK